MTPVRHTYVLVNSISRSGGRYLTALFDRHPPFVTFPVELPSGPGLGGPWLLPDPVFRESTTAEQWLSNNRMTDSLRYFADQPYGRMFSRPRRTGDPAIRFDYEGFRRDLDKAFAAEIKDAESAYLETWRLMFHHVTVDGSPQDIDVTRPCVFINHFHQHVAHDFLSMKGVQDSIDFYILYVIRNPFENIASLKHLWSRVSHLDSFVATAYWRWEIYLLNILRNRALYGDRCDIVVYHSDPREMMRQLARSRLAPLQHLTDNKNVAPTALGIPLYGHSYKERQGGSVEQPYDYLKEFGRTGLDFLRARYANLLERLGVQKFEDAIAKTPCTEFFKEVQSMGSQAFENYMSALEISMRNLPAMDNLFYEMIGEHLRKRSPLRRVLDGIRIVRAMRAKT